MRNPEPFPPHGNCGGSSTFPVLSCQVWRSFVTQLGVSNYKNSRDQDVPGGPVVKKPPYNTGDASLIPGWGTKIPHSVEQLSPCVATTEPVFHERVRAPQRKGPCDTAELHVPQLRPDAPERQTNKQSRNRNAPHNTPTMLAVCIPQRYFCSANVCFLSAQPMSQAELFVFFN